MQLNPANGFTSEDLENSHTPEVPRFIVAPARGKLLYDDVVDTSTMKQVLFIDSNVTEFKNYVNASTFPIIYDRMCTREQMIEVLNKKFASISRIAFVNHFSETPYFLNQESLFSEENKQFVVDIITQFKVSNVDYLACNTLSNYNWLNYYSALQENTGIIIGASDNNTGNIKYGGDWILESTHEDIRAVYFNDQIQNYASLLATTDYTYLGSTLTYTYDIYMGAVVKDWVSGTHVTIPSTIDISGTIYDVVILFGLGTTINSIISITIPSSIKNIGDLVFQNLSNLEYISVDALNTDYCDVSGVLFDITKTTLIFYPRKNSMTSFAIPDSVTAYSTPFFECNNLICVSLPANAQFTTIPESFFAICASLTSVIIPGSVEQIESYAFTTCPLLKKVYFMGSIIPMMSLNAIVPGNGNVYDSYYQNGASNTDRLISTFSIPVPLSSTDLFAAVSTALSTGSTGSALANAPTIIDITKGDQTASVDFTAGAYNGSAITNYYYSIDNGMHWTARSPASTSIPISLTELENGTPYSIKLKAFNINGLSDESNVKSVTPAGLPISPYIYKIIPGNKLATIKFTSGFNNGSAITNYKYICTPTDTPIGTNWIPLDPLSVDTSIVVSELTNGQSYQVKIKAMNVLGDSIESNTTSVTPIAPPDAPTITISDSVTSIGDSTATINISDNDTNGSTITNYKYSIDNGNNWTDRSPASTESSLVLTELENGKTYLIMVKAMSAEGEVEGEGEGGDSPSSNALSITPASLPYPPTIDGIISGNQSVTINFSDHFNNGSAIATYKHAYSSNGGSTWSDWTLRSTGTTESPLVVSGLINGQSYLVKIRAVNGKGISSESNLSSPETPAAAPDAPTLIDVVTGNSSLTINFRANAYNGSAITNYMYSIDNGYNWTECTTPITTSSIEVSELENGTTYSVKLIAMNGVGNSVPSNVISRRMAASPDAPTIIGVTGGDQFVNIAFSVNADNDSPISTYKYKYSSNSGTSWSDWIQRSTGTTASPIKVIGLSNGETYQFKIRAVNALGDGLISSISSSLMSVGAPAKPTITNVAAGNASVTITFINGSDNGSNITSYQYAYLTNGGSSWSSWIYPSSGTTSISGTTSRSLIATNLTNGSMYSLKIRAWNDGGPGAESDKSILVNPILISAPSAPTITRILPLNASAKIYFNAGNNNGSAISNYKYFIDGLEIICGITEPILITNLTNGQIYLVKLKAINIMGEGDESNTIQFLLPESPLSPTIDRIIGGNKNAMVYFTPGANNGAIITKYAYALDGGMWYTSDAAASATSMLIEPLINGTEYFITIKAISDKFPGGSAASDALPVTPVAAPDAPVIDTITASNHAATINFTAGAANGSAITNYQYSMDDGYTWKFLDPSSTISPIVVPELINGHLYFVKLIAINVVNASLESNMQKVTPCTKPAAPTINDIVRGNKNARINFTPGNNNGSALTKYIYCLNEEIWWNASDAAASAKSMLVKKLENGTEYSIKIKAVSQQFPGGGDESNSWLVTPAAAPDAPVIDTITAGNHNATINFTASAANGSAITNYQYSMDDGVDWKFLDPSSTASPIVVSELINGQQYSVKLIAINDVNASSESNMITITPCTKPAAPFINDIFRGNKNARINFTPGDDNGSDIIKYVYCLNEEPWWNTCDAAASAVSMFIRNLENGSEYSIKIKAVSHEFPEGGIESNSMSVIPAAAPEAPVIDTIIEGNNAATINFTASAANGSAITNYKYSMDNGVNWKFRNPSSTESPIVVYDLSNGQLYSVKLMAINDVNASSESNMKKITPCTKPAAPTINDIVEGNNNATIKFTPGANNGSAIIKYVYSLDGGMWNNSDAAAASTSMLIRNLENGTEYSIRIMAISVKFPGGGVESNSWSVTPVAT